LLTPPNDGTQREHKLDLRVALQKGAGQNQSQLAGISVWEEQYSFQSSARACPHLGRLLLADNGHNLTEIGFCCGFAD
jgi:hypothetical protein